MNRNNIYTVNPLYNGSTTQTTEDGSVQSGGTTIIYQQGGGTGLTDAQKQKLDGIQEGAEVNQNAYSKVRLNGSDALIIEAKNKTDILNMSGVYPIAIAINGNGGLDFTVSSDQSNTNSVVTQSQLKAAIDQLEKDKYWKVDADGKLYTELDVYSHKEISAYGAGDGGGSTGGAGALYECADVLRDGDKVKGAEVGSVLSYNGTHWYAIPQSAIVPDLSGYATKLYVSQEINDLIGGAPGTLDTLKEIAEALGNNPNFATTVTEMINNIGLRVDQVEDRVVSLEDMFEWDKSASASDPSLWRIKAKKDLYGVGEISAYGYSSGTVPTGAQYMYELKDVLFTELTSGQLLQWNGTKWINIDKNAVGLNETELAKYLTNNNYAKKSDITWANLLNKPTTWGWASITGKPTTLAGYGITDGVPNTRRVSAGSGLAGGGVLSSDVTISLGTIGTAGTYTKITTDMYGRVVSGTTLSESDIPTLQISKISGLQSALNSKLNISDFNTWFTIKKDSQGRIVSIQANYDFFSVGEISAYGLGETQPSVTTLAGLDDVTITSPANGQTLIYDSATSQWKNGTIIGGGNISLNGTVYKPVNGTITLPNLATPGDITTALSGYATQSWVTDKNYATQSWVNGKGYVTATALATMGFATQTWVNSQGFLKSNSLDNYVTLNTIQNITAAKTFQGGIVSTTFRKSDGTASQFLKADGSVDSNVYLTQSSTDTRYVLKTGDTMGGALIIDVPNIPASPSISSPTKIGFKENHAQEVAFAYTDYDSYRAPAGIKLVSTENEPWFEAPWILGRKLNMSRVATEYSAGTGAVINYFGTDTIMDNQSSSITGTLKIRLPVTWTNTMGVYKIMLYEYNGRGSSEITVSFYNYSSSQSYYNYSYQLNGAFEGAVRIAHDGSGCCILLGDTSYNWNYIKVYVYQVFNGQNVPSNYVDQPYNISIITSEAGLSRVTSVPKTSMNRHDTNYIRALNKNGYYGMGLVGDTDNAWIRTTSTGLIPYKAGSSRDNSMLGTEAWQFGKIYGVEIFGQRVASVTHNLYVGSSGNFGWVYCQDLCSANGAAEAYWSIRINGAAVFTNLTSKNKITGDINGNADGYATYLPTRYNGGTQANPQTYFSQHMGLRVAMTGSIKCWNDTLWINGYSGSDVKDMCALHTVRDGTPQMYISTQKSDATSYGTMYLFYTSYNANKSDRPWICSTLNAYGRITTASDIYSQSWVRTVGTTGWYSESYGGGWHMTDSTWLRAYNNKQIYTASTSPDAFHTLGGVNASGRIYAGSYIETHGGLVCAGVGNSGGALGFNVYGSFYGNALHGGIEIGASDNVLGIGVHSDDSWYIWWTNSGSIGSSSNKSYIFSYNGSSWNFTGSVVASGEVTAYSDARLKSNIRTLDYRGRLIPRHYVKDGKQSIGFIAQEVQTLYPELVLGYDKSRPYLSLNYNGCTAVLSAQLNHVEDEVTMLKNKVRELEIKVSVLTEQLHSQAI